MTGQQSATGQPASAATRQAGQLAQQSDLQAATPATVSTQSSPAARKTLCDIRQLAPALHRALGLVLLTLAVWLCWSGTLSLYRAELDGWLDPQLRPAMQAGALQLTGQVSAQVSAGASAQSSEPSSGQSYQQSFAQPSAQLSGQPPAQLGAEPFAQLAAQSSETDAEQTEAEQKQAEQTESGQIEADPFRARPFQAKQLQAALHFISSLRVAAAPEVISAAAPTAERHTASAPLAAIYLEFASSAKPYLTVHLREEGSWQLQRLVLSMPTGNDGGAAGTAAFPAGADAVVPGVAATPEVQVRLLRGPEPAATGSAPQAVGSWFFSLHYQLLGLLGHYGLWLTTAVAALLLWLTLSGLLLCWQQRRRWFFAAGAGKTQRLLRWHLLAGLLVSPWLLWFCGSALFTQLGQWQPGLVEQAGLTRAAYYAQLFPAPAAVSDLAAAASANKTATKPATLAALARAAQLALQQARWPVAKLQLELSSGRLLLTQHAASQLQQPPYQLQQQTFDAGGQPLAQAPYPTDAPWQLRNSLYALHQAVFAGPGLRALLFAGGCLTVIMLLLASESFARRYASQAQCGSHHGGRHYGGRHFGGRHFGGLWLLRILTSGFVLASLLLLALRTACWLSELSTTGLFAVCWGLVSILLGIGGRFVANKSGGN